MKKHRYLHINRRGKMLVLILSTLTLCLFVGLVVNKHELPKKRAASISFIRAEQLSLSFEPKKTFAKSELNQSVLEKKEKARQEAQAKREAAQRAADQKEKAIYLTFDDGPSPESDQLLDMLHQYQAKATFFMLGPNIQNHPQVVQRMVNEGFGVGMHGITHNAKQIYSSKEAPLNEMTEDQRIIEQVTGVHSRLVRLPYGSIPYLTDDMRYLLDQKAFKIWDWNVDSRDWELKDKRYVQQTILEIQKVEQVGETPIVLLHDKAATVQHLPKLLNYLQQQGYRMKILTNEMPPFTFKCGGRCYSIS